MVIEDKLQDGEPDMIHKLQMAGIKVLYFVVIHQETRHTIKGNVKM